MLAILALAFLESRAIARSSLPLFWVVIHPPPRFPVDDPGAENAAKGFPPPPLPVVVATGGIGVVKVALLREYM